jgi:5-methylcytosine-specific restriction endonuclease McrA
MARRKTRSRRSGLILTMALVWLKNHGAEVKTPVSNSRAIKLFLDHPELPRDDIDWEMMRTNRHRALWRYFRGYRDAIQPRHRQASRKHHGYITTTGDAFYDSDEWKRFRYRVLSVYGASCMCCGATREDGKKMHVDHVKPRSKYPELALDFDNAWVLCEDCNMGRGNSDEVDYRPHVQPQE